MADHGYTLFETAIGRCGIAWRGDRIASVRLPERDDATTRAGLVRAFPDFAQSPPPSAVAAVTAAITSLLRGEPTELSGVELDLDAVPPFHQRVYQIARSIPPGATMTYGEIASRLGGLSQARAVGQALGHNPVPIVVPCHRVLAADGKIGGFSANGGAVTKLRLLAIESPHRFGALTLFDEIDILPGGR